jgi:hypothetical protein
MLPTPPRRPTPAELVATRRKLADNLWRFVADKLGAPVLCPRAKCQRTGRCVGAPRVCQEPIEAALEVEKADPGPAKALVHHAIGTLLAQRQAEAAAAPSGKSRGAKVRPAWAPALPPAAAAADLASFAAFAKEIEERIARYWPQYANREPGRPPVRRKT